MSLPTLIILYGPDGVGKSTQIDILAKQLTADGHTVKKVWLRGPHTMAFLLSRILIKAGRTRHLSNPFGRVKTLPDIGTNPLIKQLWALTEFVSVLPLLVIRVILPLKLGYHVLADRYVLDVVVSTAFYINDPNFIRHKISNILMGFIPTSSVLIHLDADYDTLIKRRGNLVEPESFIDFQKNGYALLSQRVPTHYIDTSKLTVDETSEAIQGILRNCKG